MARPSKLTDKQWADIEKRALAGEPIRALAREYGVTESPIRHRVKTQAKPLKEIAKQLAMAEIAMESLPIKAQVIARTLADTLKGISYHLGSAAEYGAMTSHRLSMIANAQVDKIDDTNPLGSIETIREIGIITELSNKSASTALNLLAANKGSVNMANEAPAYKPKTLAEFYGEAQ